MPADPDKSLPVFVFQKMNIRSLRDAVNLLSSHRGIKSFYAV